MFSKVLLIIAAIAIFMVVPSFGGPATGCNKIKFLGSYTRPVLNQDILLDGTVIHSTAFQLNLSSDGTAIQYWTGFPDYAINTGTGSPWIGSWTCRIDGKLVVTFISATFAPVSAGSNPYVTAQDVALDGHARTTYLFSVDDQNTLTKIQSRSRFYAPTEDPTDEAGGILGNLSTITYSYKRLIASDADLLAP
jgi:hypothetical protein